VEKVKVSLGYDILVGRNLISRAGSLLKPLDAKKAFFISDSRLSSTTSKLASSLRKAGWETNGLQLPAREATKDFRKIFPIYSKLIQSGMDRHSVLIAVGGGVIGDLAGFVAGTYLRGIRWVGVPTTLLAQVDSSIGGKTGVNHPLGKNLIGVFHQPSLVLCDTDVLSSLSRRDVVSGVGEIVKYGLAFDKIFFTFLEESLDHLLELERIEKAVHISAKWKAQVVGKDPLETKGLRALLNFGHTLGHALEAATGYGYFRHGEAIVWGMRWAANLSTERGHLAEKDRSRIETLLTRLPVPEIPKQLTLQKLLSFTKHDKKIRDGKIGFVLLDKIGHAIVDRKVEKKHLAAAIS